MTDTRDPLEKSVDRAWHETKVQAAVRAERERCAKIADAHRGAAAKKRRARGPQADNSALDEIYAEERGEDIAAEIIARTIREAT